MTHDFNVISKLISPEHESDFDEIYNLVTIAFLTSKDADGDEQDYVNQLRKSENYIPELALVLKLDSRIIGHIMFTKTWIHQDQNYNSKKTVALLLSPVCIHPEFHHQGYGSLLIRYGIEKSIKLGYKAVFLVGEPEYYSRFGFVRMDQFGIKDTGNIPTEYTLAMDLETGFLSEHAGVVSIC